MYKFEYILSLKSRSFPLYCNLPKIMEELIWYWIIFSASNHLLAPLIGELCLHVYDDVWYGKYLSGIPSIVWPLAHSCSWCTLIIISLSSIAMRTSSNLRHHNEPGCCLDYYGMLLLTSRAALRIRRKNMTNDMYCSAYCKISRKVKRHWNHIFFYFSK